MQIYTQEETQSVYWPAPIEQSWQTMPARAVRSEIAAELAKKMPHLGLSDILLIAAVVNAPERPHGIITWLGGYYDISRVSVYQLGERVKERLAPPDERLVIAERLEAEKAEQARLKRTIMTAAFPGNVSIRPTRAILQEAFGQDRGVGYISELRLEAGYGAGEILSGVNYASLGPVIALRDETFFQGWPLLLLVEPISTTIVSAYVSPDRQADTWALALLMAQEQGLTLSGLTEDMAKPYDKSLKLAGLEKTPQQKDIWHLQREGSKIRQALERGAYRAMAKVIDLEKKLQKSWDDDLFEQDYLSAINRELSAIEAHDQVERDLGHLQDALTLVDIHNGSISDLESCQWLLTEVISDLAQLDVKRVKKFVKTLRKHQAQLLTFLTWTGTALRDYETQLASLIPDDYARQQFIQTVAHSWHLDQALINGHRQWQAAALQAKTLLQSVTAAEPHLAQFALDLRHLLDASGRTSSLIEALNSLLKSFFRNRKGFKNQQTLQAYLNLFVLWHNMRVYDPRSKRGGQSPFQIAGIDLGCDDWLTLLGFPPAS